MDKPSVPIALWDNVQKRYILHDSAEFEGSPLHDLYESTGSIKPNQDIWAESPEWKWVRGGVPHSVDKNPFAKPKN